MNKKDLIKQFSELYKLKFVYEVSNSIMLFSDFYVSTDTMKTAISKKVPYSIFKNWYEESLESDIKTSLSLEKYLKSVNYKI